MDGSLSGRYRDEIIFVDVLHTINYGVDRVRFIHSAGENRSEYSLLRGTEGSRSSANKRMAHYLNAGRNLNHMNAQAGAERRPDDIRIINVKGQLLRIAIRPGKGTGTPLLLMNGIGVSFEVFQPFIDELTPDIEIIRFDVPGTGGSPRPAMPYRFSTLARMTAGMLDQLGYNQVDVLGISWGGGLAQQFAIQYRQRCRRLVLVSTGPGTFMVPCNPSVLTKMATPQRYQDPIYMSEIAADIYGGDLRSNPEFVRQMAHAMQSNEPLGYFYQLMAGMGWTSLPWLSFLRQPTLIIAGDDDPLVPSINSKIMQRLIPYSKLYIYHGGHLGLVTHARELSSLIEKFLSAEIGNIRGRSL
jgi:poly(3-hydroxyalkanoate) depolymerase